MSGAKASEIPKPRWLALDVGGANLKAAHSDGSARSSAFAVWKDPAGLSRAVADLVSEFAPFDRVAATMTAELCDCYETKRDGVCSIVQAVGRAIPGRPVLYWGTDGAFHDEEDVLRNPLTAAASNWLALATVAARLVPDDRAILVDVGSTTTDLIPLDGGRVAARGRTDLERLRNGELVYAGASRTPVCALADELPFQGRPTGLAAELFATTQDVYLILGPIESDPDYRSTADGRPATRERAVERLARMVCADRESCSVDDIVALAREADRLLLAKLVEGGRRACRETIGAPTTAVVSGSGEFLARRAARELVGPAGVVHALGELWPEGASDAACAYALIQLAEDQQARERECG